MNRARCLVWAGSLAVALGLAGLGLTSAGVSWASDSGASTTSESAQTSGGSSSEGGSPSTGGSTAGGTDSADSDDGPAGGSGAGSDADDADDADDRPGSSESAADEIGEGEISDGEQTDAIDDIDAIDDPAAEVDDNPAEVVDDAAADESADAVTAARIERRLDDDHPSESTIDSTAAAATVEDEPSPAASSVARSTTDEAAPTAASRTPGAETIAATTLGPAPPAAPAATPARSTATVQSWFQRTFFAVSPKFPTQTVSVQIDPVDPRPTALVLTLATATADGRPLTYTVGRAAGSGGTAGTLRISDGSATYTPPPGWDSVTPHTDTFTVTASDADGSFHIHGLAGLIHRLTFGLFGSSGHSVTSTVTVNVVAATPAPEPPEPPEAPVPAGSFPVAVNNNTGTHRDDEVHLFVIGQTSPGRWAWVDRGGTAHSLDHTAADAPGHLEKNGVNYADMSFTVAEAGALRVPPELLGGRIYVSLGAPLYIGISGDDNGWAAPDPANPADPNYQTVYDWYELSFKNGSVPFGGNTTQVDQFGFPFTFTVTQDASGFSGTRGIALTRDEVLQRFTDTVPSAFQALVIKDIDGRPIRILAPRSQQPGELATWFDEPIDAFWAKYRAEQFVYDGPGYTVTGDIGADNRFAYTVAAAGGGSTTHAMDKPTTQDVFRADGPFVGQGLQGAFLAELDAAFNRGVASAPNDWNNVSAYYPAGRRWNNWAQFFHHNSVQGFAYGFPYDDVNSQSSVLILGNSEPLTELTLTLGAQRQ